MWLGKCAESKTDISGYRRIEREKGDGVRPHIAKAFMAYCGWLTNRIEAGTGYMSLKSTTRCKASAM